jgi:hypothetical protein
MGLSRLDNFLKSGRGTILYVDGSSLDSTDSIENSGNSLTRPFKTIQRALIESARFSYQRGLNNDRFNKTTILLYPGDHLIDNRPGWIPDELGSFKLRNLSSSNDFSEWTLSSNFDLNNSNNALYKLNSVHGGVIVPRGTSIVGMDLRKTRIRPTFVPDPINSNIDRTAILRLTGGCYLWQFTILDADPNASCFKDYTSDKYASSFSHHKVTAFEYADGVNPVSIQYLSNSYSTDRTDLDIYYEKVALAYGTSMGDRNVPDPNYSSDPVTDIQPVVDEYRIVGPSGQEVGISSVSYSGTTVTAYTQGQLTEINVDSPIQISGVDGEYSGDIASGFDGQFVVSAILSPTQIRYRTATTPIFTSNTVTPQDAILSLAVDTVTSASPYIFNISLRSVYGMCGLLADGDKASGFKSMVVAQFTGIGLQKDDNAFVKYDTTTGTYQNSSSIANLHTNSDSTFKPEYENFHIKATNNSFIQLVSIFAIGYAQHFVVESGGDHSITNSNSNFGAKALVSKGFRSDAFLKDDWGYITHIIPPQEIESEETSISFGAIDVGLTTSVGNSSRLYLYNEDNQDIPPSNVIDGYRVGAKVNDTIFVKISQAGISSQYSSRIVIPNTQLSKEKSFDVAKSGTDNNISTTIYTITLTSNHTFETGEKVRVISHNGHLPDGIKNDQVYYVITSGLGSNQIRLAQTLTNAFLGTSIIINDKGGNLRVVSRVSDKNSGNIGHPIQWDSTNSNWYINVASSNQIYTLFTQQGVSVFGEATPRTYLTRTQDVRNIKDTLYRLRYVIPKESLRARPPLDGFIIQESNNTVGSSSTTEILKYFGTNSPTVGVNELRNVRFIADATWSSNKVTIKTELPHNLEIGTEVEIFNIKSTNNLSSTYDLGFNGKFIVNQITNSREFSYSLTTNPGTFSNDTSVRNANLPTFRKKTLNNTFSIFSSEEVQEFIQENQDGVYHLTVVNASNSPTLSPFDQLEFSQPIQNLYPQSNRDNPNSDPEASICFALPNPIGQVVINDPENSITKESLNKFANDLKIGIGISNIISNSVGTAHTIFTEVDHKLSGITSVSIINGGSNYIPGTYYASDLIGSSTGKTANARISVGIAGTVTNVLIMDGGSGYIIGNTLSITPSAGIGTTTGFVPANVQVTSVSDNIGDIISISGVGGTFAQYNTLYRVTGISTDNRIQVSSASTIVSPSTNGIDSTLISNSFINFTGKVILANSFTYNSVTGIATIGFSASHGLKVNNKVRISGVNSDYFNKNVIVKKVNNLTSINVNIGKGGVGLSTSGTIYVYKNGYTSNAGTITLENENLSGRLIADYAGITTAISAQILAPSDSNLTIPNASILGFKVGDYFQIDDEIFRIKSNIDGNSIPIHRALFGTPREFHQVNSVVRRIRVNPIELRRNSIIRASGHTFEYLGFGPGNYSTALPDKQTRKLSSQEEQLSQSYRINGGIINYTAMNSDGDFYTGNKKINSTTGQEETFDSPIPNVTGEEKDLYGVDVTKTSEVYIDRSIKVEGGPEKNLISEFEGPVIFSEKITSTSSKGIEAKSLFIQGEEDVARNISISTSSPTLSGNYGDISINAEPKLNSNVGWIYTSENDWKRWGWIRGENDSFFGVGVSSAGGPVGFSSIINFVGTGVSVSVIHGSSGISTVLVKGDPVNYIGITSEGSFVGLATAIEFVGEDDGFGMTVKVGFNPSSGIATVTLGTPINVVNFGSGILGDGIPSFASTSVGTRIVYSNTLNGSDLTNYATGVGNNASLWWSVPNNSFYSFNWYGGETEIARLASNGALSIFGSSTVTAGQFISTVTTGTSPLSIGSSTIVSNLNANYLNGYIQDSAATPNTIVLRDGLNNINANLNGNATGLIHSGIGQTGEWYTDIPARLGYTPFNKAGDICTGISTFNELITLKKVSDIYVNTNTAGVGIGTTLTCNFNASPIARSTSANIGIIDIINVPELDERVFNYTIGITATSSVSNLANIQFRVNGVEITTGGNRLIWLNNITPTGISSGYYMMGFTIFRVSNNWEVLGVFANYS